MAERSAGSGVRLEAIGTASRPPGEPVEVEVEIEIEIDNAILCR